MTDLARRVGLAVAGGAVLLATYAVIYRWGMLTFEGGQVSTSSQSNGGVTSTPTPVPGS